MKQRNKLWRIAGLLLTIAGIIFNYIKASGNKLSVITAQYESLFVPADYAFAIWSVIYLAVIIYSVYSLSPAQQQVQFHNGLAKLLILIAVGGMAWITWFTSEQPGLSIVFILIMLVLSLLLVKSAHLAITEKNQTRWLMVPFGLYAAWLCVATISNLSLYIKSAGWLEGVLNESIWAIIMLIIAFSLSIAAALRFRTVTFPLVIAWATIAIYFRQRNAAESVGYAALAVSVLLIVFVVIFFVREKAIRKFLLPVLILSALNTGAMA